MIEQFDLSEHHACGLVGLSRDSYRHPPVPDETTVALSTAILDIAQVHSNSQNLGLTDWPLSGNRYGRFGHRV